VVVRPESDIPPCVDVGDKSGGSRRGLGTELVVGSGAIRPKKRTRNVNSAEALSSRTRLMDLKIASTGKIYHQRQYQHQYQLISLSSSRLTRSLSSAM
jgi:hypothetical protein